MLSLVCSNPGRDNTSEIVLVNHTMGSRKSSRPSRGGGSRVRLVHHSMIGISLPLSRRFVTIPQYRWSSSLVYQYTHLQWRHATCDGHLSRRQQETTT